MEYRLLGRSGLKVSTLTMGTMSVGGKGNFAKVGAVGPAEAARLVDLCVDAGVNMIDTADAYSEGLSEEIIGDILKIVAAFVIVKSVRPLLGKTPAAQPRPSSLGSVE